MAPVELKVVFHQLAGVGHALLALALEPQAGPAFNLAAGPSLFKQGQCFHQQRPGEVCQAFCQVVGVVQKTNGQAAFQQHRPGVEALLHGHDPHPRLAVTCQQAPLDRPRTPPAGQQGAMAVPAAQGGLGQDCGGQDLAEGHYHVGISSQGGELFLAGEILADPFRGEHG